jgi:simple sugar transport system substrate-binding protein
MEVIKKRKKNLNMASTPLAIRSSIRATCAAGILTFTHEASNQKQVSFDLEAFDNVAYGRHMMDVMAKDMNYEGEYACFVGHLTSTTHNEWVDGEIAQQKEK